MIGKSKDSSRRKDKRHAAPHTRSPETDTRPPFLKRTKKGSKTPTQVDPNLVGRGAGRTWDIESFKVTIITTMNQQREQRERDMKRKTTIS